MRRVLRAWLSSSKDLFGEEDAVAFAESYARQDDTSALVWIVSVSENDGESNYQSAHLTKLGAVTTAAEWVLDRLENDLMDASELQIAELENLEHNLSEAIKQKDAETLETLVDEYNDDLPRGTDIQVYRQAVE